tara:strand:+ start:49 stop:636 length:588 start_codon:yes stop_codon:yes gene_type:complete
MAFNITAFRSGMAFDGQRPNLFEVTIPKGTGDIFDGDDLNLFAKGTSIPGATIGTVIVPYFGREIKLAGNRTFPEWTITVLNDENFSFRSQFENWMHLINGHGDNVRGTGGTSTSYTKTANVKQYGKTGSGTTSAHYSFVNLFPTDLSEITLDWGDNDTVEEYTVTFSYDYWIRAKGTVTGGKGTMAAAIAKGTA